MVTAIEVRRKSAISWVLIPDGVAANDVQEAWWRGTRIGNNITFKSTNGAVEFKDINYQFISYVDEVTPANNKASFTSAYECFNYLKEQGFFDVGSDGGVSGSTFIGDDDTPATYLGQALKLLRVNASATAVEFFQKAIASQLSELVDGPGAYSNGKYLKSTVSGWAWSDGFNVNQNNIGLKVSLGFHISETPPTITDIVTLANQTTIVVSEIQTPVIVSVRSLPSILGGNPTVNKLYPYLFLPGKGTYGISGTAVTPAMLFQLPSLNLTPEDIEDDPNASIVNLDPVVDGDFVSKANESFWDFSDSDYQNGGQSYYFSYTDDGVLYYALFIGTPGTYGDGATPFTEDDFVDTTNSGVDPEPSDNYVLKNPSPETEQTIQGDITITGDIYNEYIKTITVGAGGDYTTLEDLFDDEPAGKTLIKLTDKTYNCLNPKFVMKKGWILQGQGYGRTTLTFTFTTPIDPDTSSLHVREDCQIRDIKIISVNNTDYTDRAEYALHADYSTYSFVAKFTRCWLKTISSSSTPNGYNGLALGIGSWENQVLEFHDCIIEGQGISIDNKYTLNQHTLATSSAHVLPSRVSYYNCDISGGYTAVLITDTYQNHAEPNIDRIRDVFEFNGCDIKGGIWLATFGKTNGILYNCSGTTIDEFINISGIDTSIDTYNVNSLPKTKDVEFLKNLGASTINAGDFVSYVYDDRLPEYHLSSGETINTPIGIEKLTSSNYNTFAGISLVTSASDAYNHFAKGAIAYTSLTSTDLNIGDNVNFDTSGVLVFSNDGGIGKVVKKTYNNRLGILINPEGKVNNIIGSSSKRGVSELEGNTFSVGAPTVRLTDYNTGAYGWQMTVGTNPNIMGGYEHGRLGFSDLDKGVERFGISETGVVKFSVPELTIQNLDSDSGIYSRLLVGTALKPGYIKLSNSYNSGNGFEIFQLNTGETTFNSNSSTVGMTLTASGSQKLQVNGEVKVSAATIGTSAVNLDQLNSVGGAYVAKTANYTLVYADGVVDFTSGNNVATLPDATTMPGKRYFIKNSGTGVTIVNTTSAQTIDGLTRYDLIVKNSAVMMVSDGANWKILTSHSNGSVIDNTYTTSKTSSQLNADYSGAAFPFVVYAPLTAGSPMVYIKTSATVWVAYAGVIA